MKFGKTTDIDNLDLSLPEDYKGNATFLKNFEKEARPNIYVGCSGWTKSKLNNFFPKGTKDELTYYSSQFNSIEMNASFYRTFSPEQFMKWKNKTPDDFKFFPKVFQGISHWKRLQDAQEYIVDYINGVERLEEKLGMCFLQMHNNFAPTQDNIQRLRAFCSQWELHIPLAVEVRHTDWYKPSHHDALCKILSDNQMTKIITDTAGRRDIIDMRLTSDTIFIRFVGTAHTTDHTRLDAWVERLKVWRQQGLNNIYFFIHQHEDQSTVELSRYFIKKLNEALNTDLKLPNLLGGETPLLF